MRIGRRGIAIVLLLTGCVEYDCGDDLDYSPREHRCVCREGFAEADGGVCTAVDAGPLDCAGGAAAMNVYDDADGDGFGRPDTEHLACPDTPGTTTNADDCDDACATCYPGATEVCDGRDNDCTSGADDTFACVQGSATECETACGSTGTATCATDCTLPATATCSPPSETCNATDDDCDGLADEGVLGFGAPADWLDSVGRPADWQGLAGDNLHIEARVGGLVVVWNDEAGVHAHLTDAAGRPNDTRVDLVTAINVRHLDTDVRGDVLYVAYSVETTYPAHELFVLAAELPSLEVTAGPRRIASLESSPDTLHVEHSYATMVFYEPYRGLGVRMRSGINIQTDAFPERIAVDVRASEFDVVAPSIATTRAYIVYSGQLTEAEDREIFVQPVTPNGADGAAHRVTDNALDDNYPVAIDAEDRLAIAWAQRADEAAVTGMLRAQSVVPASGTGWSMGSEITTMPLGVLSTYSIAPRARGWLVFQAELVDAMASRVTVRPLAWDTSSVGMPRELEFAGRIAFVVSTPRLIDGVPWLAIGRGAEEVDPELDARSVGCD